MYITNNYDPAFRFEDLARFTFGNCLKYGDPWHYAAQEVYNNFIPIMELRGQRILSTILNKLIYDYRNDKICKQLLEIENSIWTTTKQADVITLIDTTIGLLQD